MILRASWKIYFIFSITKFFVCRFSSSILHHSSIFVDERPPSVRAHAILSLLPGGRKFSKLTQKGPNKISFWPRNVDGRTTANFAESGQKYFQDSDFGNFLKIFLSQTPKKHKYESEELFCLWQNLFLDLAGKPRWNLATLATVAAGSAQQAVEARQLLL